MRLLLLCVVVIFPACLKQPPRPTPHAYGEVAELARRAEELADQAQATKNKNMSAEFASQGLEIAQSCLKRDHNFMACRFYRAVNRGLYLRSHLAGYKQGLKQMVTDAKWIAAKEPAFEEGGAWRMLALISLKAPGFGLTSRAGQIHQDLDLAQDYIDKALKAFPDNPDNLDAAAQIATKRGEIAPARSYIQRLENIVKTTKMPEDERHDWQKKVADLKDELKGWFW